MLDFDANASANAQCVFSVEGQLSTCQYFFSSKCQQGHSQNEVKQAEQTTKNIIKIASANLDWHSTVTFWVLSSLVQLPIPSSQRSLSQGRLSCCSACVILPLSFLSQWLRPPEGTVRIHKRTRNEIRVLQHENHAIMDIANVWEAL